MSATSWKYLWMGVAACGAFLAAVPPISADSKHDYTETGRVISATADHGHVYTIETGDKIYRMLCMIKLFHSTPPQCKIAGKPIVVNDTVRFRRDDDTAYIPNTDNSEERLLILSTELKVLSPLPAGASLSAGEHGAVLGMGVQVDKSQNRVGTGSTIPSGPVLATPVTGGPPVVVIPTGPAGGGGVITGTPVTGGPPITAIPVTPITSYMGGQQAVWAHFLRLQTSDRVYDLACPSKSCSLKSGAIQLGDVLSIRIEKKYAYLSLPVPGPSSEQRFAILAVRNVDDPPEIPPQ